METEKKTRRIGSQIGLRQSITGITTRHADHYAQVREYQLTCGIQVILGFKARRQDELSLLR